MDEPATLTLPRGQGTAIFAGGGAWLPPAAGGSHRGDEAVLLHDPCRILVASAPDDVPLVIAEVEAEQQQGRYAAGYLAYEAGAAFELAVQTPCPDALPLAWFAVYPPEAVATVPAARWRRYLDDVDVARVTRALAGAAPALSVTRDEYVRAVGRVREFIAAGDTYQVNYTVRGRFSLDGLEAEGPLDPLDYFLALTVRQPVPYAGFLDLGEAQVVSLSPELFLRRVGRHLESRPMKGTRPRGATHEEDVDLAYELAGTEKERAENLMIVDMVRNDLGRVCRTGTVRVPTLYAVEPYRTVWQMVSTVVGDIPSGTNLGDIMRAVFPGASISGAPKHHTMEIIAALETEPRNVYTGALGLFCPGGDFSCNICIRTIVHRRGLCRLGVGSGVVWDAAAGAEYEETLAKAAFALSPRNEPWRPRSAVKATARGPSGTGIRLFETILLDGRYRFLHEHLTRLAASARQLGFAFDGEKAQGLLAALAADTSGASVVRLDLDEAGHFHFTTREIPQTAAPVLLLSPFRTDPDDPFLRHKTSLRSFYDREHRRAVEQGCLDALFLNRLDRVTEGAVTNLFARFGNRWVTPPLEDGLLPGLWRAAFLQEKGAGQRSLTLAELLTADEIVVGNSVRGATTVAEVLADPLVY